MEGAKIERLKPGEQDPVAPGTPIATFIIGAYPDWSGTGHAAIYVGQNQQGIEIMDQWVGKPAEKSGPFKGKVVVSPRWLYWSSGPTHGVNDPSIYSVVTW